MFLQNTTVDQGVNEVDEKQGIAIGALMQGSRQPVREVVSATLTGCSSGGGGNDDCEARVSSAPDGTFNDLFTRFGDGWTGGGNVHSIRLADGRTVWFSGQTYLGIVNPDRSRPRETLILDNSLLLQDGLSLTTRLGGTPDAPESFFTPVNMTETYVPRAAVVEGDRVRVMLGTSVGVCTNVRTDVATLSLPDLDLLEITTVSPRSNIAYGTSLLEQGGFVHIYGVEEVNSGQDKFMHVARAVRGDLLGPWEYFDGTGWSTDPAASARVFEGVSSDYSVLEFNGTLLLVSQALKFSNEINIYRATSPAGPWTNRVAVFCTPAPGADIVTINALAHSQVGRAAGDQVLISYMVSPFFNPDLAFVNADNFRPRFIRVPLGEVLSR